MNLRTVKIGLEVHVSLGVPKSRLDDGNLHTKLFCPCPLLGRKALPNSSICPVCTGIPGSLPVLQRRVGRLAVRLCRALGAHVAPRLIFDRKRYFYHDLPRSYQITQMMYPVGHDGTVAGTAIQRIQVEEDPARFQGKMVDYNRCGKMLVQIVTAPTLCSPEQAVTFLEQLFYRLSINGLMDQSAETLFRADVNVSSAEGDREHPRVEIKNLGSLKQVKDSIDVELRRQVTSVDSMVHTRSFEPAFERTVFSRAKETLAQYAPVAQCNLPPIDTCRFAPFVYTRCPSCLGGGPLETAPVHVRMRLRGWGRVPGALDYAFFTGAKGHFIDMLLAESKYRKLSFLQFPWNGIDPLVKAGDREGIRRYLDRLAGTVPEVSA